MKSKKREFPKIPDPRAMEGMMFDLTTAMRDKNFSSVEDMNRYLKKLTGVGKIKKVAPENAAQVAQRVMYEAWDQDVPEIKMEMAKRALAIYPDCTDAYNLLAEMTAWNLEEEKNLYRKGVKAGERSLGEEAFKNIVGHFWGVIETRPYMRARKGLADCLWLLGSHEESLDHYYEMLRLNPNDNQGNRYVLLSHLSEVGDYDKLQEFMNRQDYKDDCAAEWLYSKVLLSYAQEGGTEKTEKNLREALKENKFVPDYLLGRKAIPRPLPDRLTMGGEDEAFCTADEYRKSWKKVPGLLSWLDSKCPAIRQTKIGRNNPCNCGSGTKFKKCCGA